jgi:hypothetical protein
MADLVAGRRREDAYIELPWQPIDGTSPVRDEAEASDAP